MASVSSHAAGRFCWVELATTDQPAAKAFYGSLFGWEPRDRPTGPNEVWTLLEKAGRDAGAAYTMRRDHKGVPPHWQVYASSPSGKRGAIRGSASSTSRARSAGLSS